MDGTSDVDYEETNVNWMEMTSDGDSHSDQPVEICDIYVMLLVFSK